MEDLLARVRRYACRYDLFTSRETVVVGVSGGPDSLCLLHLLVRLAPELEINLHVAHLNHGLRQAESDADAEYVAALAHQWGLPCSVGQADVRSSASRSSLEEAARHARYRFLAEVAGAEHAVTIAVGHHADDQAETVLMHFLRGSGVAGMRGMRPSAWLPALPALPARPSCPPVLPARPARGTRARVAHGPGADDRLDASLAPNVDRGQAGQIRLVRPLLSTPRHEIEAYCIEHGLQPRTDRSNEDLTFYRNRLRHELLPILEVYNPRIRKLLWQTAEIMAGDYDTLTTSLDAAWRQVSLPGEDSRGDSIPALYHPGAVTRRDTGTRTDEIGARKSRAQSRALCGVTALEQGSEAEERADDVRFDLVGWRALPLGLQRATIREAIHVLRGGLRNINWEHVERAVWLAREGRTGQMATLTAGLALEIGYDTLRVAAEATRWPLSCQDGGRRFREGPRVTQPVALAAPGVTPLAAGWQVHIRRLERAALPFSGEHPPGAVLRGEKTQASLSAIDPWVAWMDADVVGLHLGLRSRRPGDTFQPQGLGGRSARLNEFMINRKVPRNARGGWPLLVGQMGLAWICGLRLDERAIVRPDTKNIWEVRFVRDAAGQPGDQQ